MDDADIIKMKKEAQAIRLARRRKAETAASAPEPAAPEPAPPPATMPRGPAAFVKQAFQPASPLVSNPFYVFSLTAYVSSTEAYGPRSTPLTENSQDQARVVAVLATMYPSEEAALPPQVVSTVRESRVQVTKQGGADDTPDMIDLTRPTKKQIIGQQINDELY